MATGVYVKLPLVLSVNAPCDGGETSAADSDWLSTSVSFSSTPGAPTVSVPSSATRYESSTAFGKSLTGFTVMVTVAVFELASPSLARYANESLPLKLAFGVYEKLPSAASVTVPLAAGETISAVSVVPGSGSVSLASTPAAGTVNGVSSLTL